MKKELSKTFYKFFLAGLALTAGTVFANISYFSDGEQLTATRMNEIVDTINSSSGALVTISNAVSNLTSKVSEVVNSLVLAPNKVIVSSSTGSLISSNVTSTELGYLVGATSNIQSQIDNIDKAKIGLGNVQNVDTTVPSNISQNSSYRFVTDAEKTSWNNKLSSFTETDPTAVKLTGNQTVDGNKTFNGSTFFGQDIGTFADSVKLLFSGDKWLREDSSDGEIVEIRQHTAQSLPGLKITDNTGASRFRYLMNAGTLSINGKQMLNGSDAWLRLNNSNEFTSGVYTPGKLAVDGGITIGDSGVNPGGNSIFVRGSTDTDSLRIRGGSPSAGKVFISNDSNGNGSWQTTVPISAMPFKKGQIIGNASGLRDDSITDNSNYFQFSNDGINKVDYAAFSSSVKAGSKFGPGLSVVGTYQSGIADGCITLQNTHWNYARDGCKTFGGATSCTPPVNGTSGTASCSMTGKTCSIFTSFQTRNDGYYSQQVIALRKCE